MKEQHYSKGRSTVTLIHPFAPKHSGYEEEFVHAIHTAGIDFRDKLIADGAIHRFSTDRKNKKDGWYVFHGLAGAFGDWSRNINEKWSMRAVSLSRMERQRLVEQIKKVQMAYEMKRERTHEDMSQVALKKWESLAETGYSPYLKRKKVEAFGVRFNKKLLIMPLKDTGGKIWSLHWIYGDGTKRFLPGGRKKGCFHHMGRLEDRRPIIVTEGYATGASIHMATHHPTVVAFDAGNIEPVIEELRRAYPNSPIKIAGDDDVWKDTNTGRTMAQQAALKHSCSVVFPIFKSTERNPTDFNDLHLLEGVEEVKRQIEKIHHHTALKAVTIKNLLSMEIQPREMILNPILPEQGLVMIHAPRGVGKTYVSLMIANSVATGSSMFNGKWSSNKPNKVLFIDGEMPLAVMRARLDNLIKSTPSEVMCEDNLLIITPDLQDKGIANLSTLEGQQFVEEHLEGVKLLILDNYSALCRGGRENEAESWSPLQEWFLTLRRRGISVLLIHHSNKSGAQRGTSRKEDILDTVITLRKPENYDPREGARFEIHYEKARGFYGEEAAPFEACLKEENGQFLWHIQGIKDPQLDKLVELKKRGGSQRSIAEEIGVSAATINRRLKEAKEKGFLEGS